MTEELLNRYQKVRVAIVLRSFEKHLREILRLMDGHYEEGLLYVQRAHLSDGDRALAMTCIDNALEEIGRLAKTFKLESQEENILRDLLSGMAVDWADLSGLRAKDLRGSGSVHPELEKTLDPAAERLARSALILSTLAHKTAAASRSAEKTTGQPDQLGE